MTPDGRIYRAARRGTGWVIEYRIAGAFRTIFAGLDRETADMMLRQLQRAGWGVEAIS